MGTETDDPAQLPTSVLSALQGNAVDQLLMDLQGAPITLLDEDHDHDDEAPVNEPRPSSTPPSVDRFLELRGQLGVEPTGAPAIERENAPPREAPSLAPASESDDTSLHIARPPQTPPVRRFPSLVAAGLVAVAALGLWIAAMWAFSAS